MPTLNQLLHAASRTFAIGIDLLPEPLREEVQTAYLLLRVSDFLEDNEEMPPERKVRLLRLWAAILSGEETVGALASAMGTVEEDSPDALVARHVVRVHDALERLERPGAGEVVRRHVTDSTLGMARWVERGPRIADEADLDDYMHEVAGRVGWLLTELFALGLPAVARARERMMRLGREFGLALQTVNVIRGLHSDRERGWVYVPRSFLGAGADATALWSNERDVGLQAQVLERLSAKAERHLGAAGSYLRAIPRRARGVRLFCLLPYLFAIRTVALSRADRRVFTEEVKLSRVEVGRITRHARLFGWSNAWAERYARRLSVPPAIP